MAAEIWNQFWLSLIPGPRAFALFVGASPFLLWAAWVAHQVHFRGDVTPPQQEKLLRPPGYSLQKKFDDLFDSILLSLLGASFMLLIAAFSAVCAFHFFQAHHHGMNDALRYILCFGALFLISIIPGVALTVQAFRKTKEAQNTRLGLRGEQAVAEALHELADVGYRTFHDLQPDGSWNIDHVIVGTRGVYVIETKTRRRRPPRREQLKHVVEYDGRVLTFPSGFDTNAIPQAERNANWLTDFLAKKTCEAVPVESIVVIPGWYTESKGSYRVKVMNANYLRTYLRKQPEKIDPQQARRIITALDDKCRTLEF